VLLKVQARVYPINLKILQKMKKAGVWCVYYGVESGNQMVLNDIKKGTTIPQIIGAFKMAKEAGIRTFGFFMIGLPKDNRKTIEDTFNILLEVEPDFANFTILAPYPGTDIYELAIKEGSLKRISAGEIPVIPLYKNKNVSQEELENDLKRVYRRFYLRPEYLFRRLFQIRTLTEFKTSLISGLPFLKGKNPFNVESKWIMRNSQD
jgi:anaerobic magnesium-protoporphyrin IX monomethyl ester cyclase